jgi:hypothetical protein
MQETTYSCYQCVDGGKTVKNGGVINVLIALFWKCNLLIINAKFEFR